MEEMKFVVRCYKKSELAEMYFPTLSTKMAVKKLRRWIVKCEPLARELTEGNSVATFKSYTAKEVRAIVGHLGEPF